MANEALIEDGFYPSDSLPVLPLGGVEMLLEKAIEDHGENYKLRDLLNRVKGSAVLNIQPSMSLEQLNDFLGERPNSRMAQLVLNELTSLFNKMPPGATVDEALGDITTMMLLQAAHRERQRQDAEKNASNKMRNYHDRR